MYSYEDRIRVVELYIKLDKHVRPTIRQLGYPPRVVNLQRRCYHSCSRTRLLVP